MISLLLETKFFIPSWRAGAVSRPRLLERLKTGLREGCRLTLVSAPAGYGKTTLVAEWIRSLEGPRSTMRVAWLSLDEGDKDPMCFLSYLISALQSIEETPGQRRPGLFGWFIDFACFLFGFQDHKSSYLSI